jgi:hypothetical protein
MFALYLGAKIIGLVFSFRHKALTLQFLWFILDMNIVRNVSVHLTALQDIWNNTGWMEYLTTLYHLPILFESRMIRKCVKIRDT